GVRVATDAVVIDPLPMGLEFFELRGVQVGELELSVRLDNGYVTATSNDTLHQARLGEPIVIAR
ncbi:MAG: hypothetical protein ABI910_01605, partial [Gemmatimonadota bacterium]